MKYLFINSATTNMVVAIIEDGKITYLFDENCGNNTSSKMMPIIEEAFKKTNLKPNDINKIFVVNGPGSFTGIRVGLAVAKTMSYSLSIPLIPISSLEMMASNGGTALINARRGYVFVGSYDSDLNNTFKDSYMLYNDNFVKPLISYDEFDFVTEKPVIDILKVVKKHESDKGVNPHTLKPNYLKLTEAEEKFNHD